jgi:hypothetical protein
MTEGSREERRLDAALAAVRQDGDLARGRVWRQVQARQLRAGTRWRARVAAAAAAVLLVSGAATSEFWRPDRSPEPAAARSVSFETVMEMLGAGDDADPEAFVLMLVAQSNQPDP